MQYYGLKDTSLVKVPSSIVEAYIPLRLADGTSTSTATGTAGSTWIIDGGTLTSSTSSISRNLLTLSADWSSSIKFAFEGTIYTNNASYTAYAVLWDITSNTQVASSQVSTTSTTATVLRSGQFALVPGRDYGVSVWTSNSTSGISFIVGACLIVFG